MKEVNWNKLIDEKNRKTRSTFTVRMSEEDRENLKKLCKCCNVRTADMLSLLIKKAMYDLSDRIEEYEAKESE